MPLVVVSDNPAIPILNPLFKMVFRRRKMVTDQNATARNRNAIPGRQTLFKIRKAIRFVAGNNKIPFWSHVATLTLMKR
jgi:hypothetical protein